jgi:hypothetical protein
MNKVAIATIVYISNYGTVLQAYATQQILRKLGYDSEIIQYLPKRVAAKQVLLACGSASTKNLLRRFASITVRLPGNLLIRKVFARFVQRYLHFTAAKYETAAQARENPPKADIFLTGSDQVWNSKYNEGIDCVYYLGFVPNGKKKVAYAASIGSEDYLEHEKQEIRRLLAEYDFLSVREKSAQQAIRALGINHVQHVLDPTLLLSVADWSKLFAKRKVKDQYLLLYILGRDKKLITIGETLAKERNLKIVKIGLDFIFSSKVARNDFFCSPNEFLSYFYHADYVVTNSFHGLSFILNFRKQFSIVLPQTFATRLESPLAQFGLERRIIRDDRDLAKQKKPVDYTRAEPQLQKAKEESIQFLKEALTCGYAQ